MPSENQQVLKLEIDCFMIRFLSVFLTVGFFLPFTACAENKSELTTNEISNTSENVMLSGIVLTTCYGVKKKYLTSTQQEDMIAYAIRLHKGLKKAKELKGVDEIDILSRVMERYPKCLSE